ncbi:MAG: hypothetical protein JOS17DRAFT_702736, partial [Linnemannia elongata]
PNFSFFLFSFFCCLSPSLSSLFSLSPFLILLFLHKRTLRISSSFLCSLLFISISDSISISHQEPTTHILCQLVSISLLLLFFLLFSPLPPSSLLPQPLSRTHEHNRFIIIITGIFIGTAYLTHNTTTTTTTTTTTHARTLLHTHIPHSYHNNASIQRLRTILHRPPPNPRDAYTTLHIPFFSLHLLSSFFFLLSLSDCTFHIFSSFILSLLLHNDLTQPASSNGPSHLTLLFAATAAPRPGYEKDPQLKTAFAARASFPWKARVARSHGLCLVSFLPPNLLPVLKAPLHPRPLVFCLVPLPLLHNYYRHLISITCRHYHHHFFHNRLKAT